MAIKSPASVGPGGYSFGGMPCFLAVISGSDVADVTGDGTAYTPIFNSEIYDQSASYDNTTGIFTAPVTGRYAFGCTLYVKGWTGSHTGGNILLVASNRTLGLERANPYGIRDAGAAFTMKGFTYVDMDAADTARITFSASGSTKVVDLAGGGDACFFYGSLVA